MRNIRLRWHMPCAFVLGLFASAVALLRVGVVHEYETYEGDHMNKVAERFEKMVVPFFAKELAQR